MGIEKKESQTEVSEDTQSSLSFGKSQRDRFCNEKQVREGHGEDEYKFNNSGRTRGVG